MLGLGVFAATFALYGIVAVRAERVGASRPLVFVGAGALVAGLGWVQPLPNDRPDALLLRIAELALALVLFADASRMGFASFRRGLALPLRLVGPGLLLAVGVGTALAALVLGRLDLWEYAALAVILAPTDVSLCAAALHEPRIPPRISQALDVEAGLNEGFAVPLLLLFVAGATVAEGLKPGSFWASTMVAKIGGGLLAGVLAGVLAGEVAQRARRSGSFTPASEGLALAGFAVAVFAFTTELGASGLVAAYAAGLAATARTASAGEPALGFAEAEGALVATFIFFALGLAGVELLDAITWPEVAYAILSLVLVRPVSVALALAGTGLRRPTIAFMGWFGPRGLPSVVLALIVLADRALPGTESIARAALVAVVLSIVLHGLSAVPLARRYGDWAASLPPDARERAGAPGGPHAPVAPSGATASAGGDAPGVGADTP